MAEIDLNVLNSDARRKIKLTELIDLIQDNALGLIDPPLDQNRINCARILLGKAMPDLKATEVTGAVKVAWALKL